MLGLCVFLAFLVNLQLPRGVASSALSSAWAHNPLDLSWPQVLAHALLQHMQWGPQLSFTYGPLGFVTPYMSYVANMFWPYVIAQWFIATLFAILIWHAFRQLALYRLFFLAASLITFGFWVAGDAAWLSTYALSIAALVQLLQSKKRSAWLMIDVTLISVLPALLPLVKVTLLVPWLVWLVAGVAICLLARERRLALWFLLTGIAFPLLGWYTCGQEFSHLGEFLHESLQIATGYSEAMQYPNKAAIIDPLGLLAAGLSTVIIALYVLQQRQVRDWFVAAVFLIVIACAFKLGFTRADWLHLPIFTAASLISMISLPYTERLGKIWPLSSRRAIIKISQIYVVLLIAVGISALRGNLAVRTLSGVLTFDKITASLQVMISPRAVVNDYEMQAAVLLETVDLPQIHEYVGKDPVDVMSYEQGVAYANHLNLVFRPIFQSYSAYTPDLIRRNDDFYNSPAAPKWVIFKLQTIDNRLPSEDDALLFTRIATSYVPVLSEKGYLLLKYEPSANQRCSVQSATPIATSMGHWLDLSSTTAGMLNVRIGFKLSFWGKFKAIVLRAPVAAIEVQSDDGQTRRYRLVPAAAETGFIISPLLNDTQEYLGWRMGKASRRVTALRVVPWNSSSHSDFSSQISVSMQPFGCSQAISTAIAPEKPGH